ncbi:MAG: sulfatase-like hydrolase/transferase [Chitinophagaceae bacterium]
MVKIFLYVFWLFCVLCVTVQAQRVSKNKPTIRLILTDDMGYGDISSFNGRYQTPNIDKIAAEGLRLTNYYSAAPICSPSRVGLLTGMFPARWNFTTFLHTRAANRKAQQVDYLDTHAPSIARVLKEQGYATAHFGKWHMGGGRDVTDAPNFDQYGFDAWSSTYESPDADPLLTATNWIWSDKDSIKRWDRTAYFVDKTLAFLKQNKGKPCYVNLWPDDVHTPWVAGDDKMGRYPGGPNEEKSFVAVLKEYDRQMGRLMQGLKELGIDSNTLVVFTSDNGPLPNFRHDRSAAFRGSKLSLYEGGIRMPFIVRWPGKIDAGVVDSVSVVAATDLFQTFAKIAGARLPDHYRQDDGEDKEAVLLGKKSSRTKILYWEYGRNSYAFNYPKGTDKSPSLALRDKNWKFLVNADGTDAELYNLETDPEEKQNVADGHHRLVDTYKKKLLSWWESLPPYPDSTKDILRKE